MLLLQIFPPSTVFSSVCCDGEKEYIFPLLSAHHQGGLYGKVQAAPGGHGEEEFSPRSSFVQAEMSAQPEQGSLGMLVLLGWIDLRLNSARPSLLSWCCESNNNHSCVTAVPSPSWEPGRGAAPAPQLSPGLVLVHGP